MSAVASPIKTPSSRKTRVAFVAVPVVVLLVAMGLSTKVAKIGSGDDSQTKVFEPVAYGKAQFPKSRAAIEPTFPKP